MHPYKKLQSEIYGFLLTFSFPQAVQARLAFVVLLIQLLIYIYIDRRLVSQ